MEPIVIEASLIPLLINLSFKYTRTRVLDIAWCIDHQFNRVFRRHSKLFKIIWWRNNNKNKPVKEDAAWDPKRMPIATKATWVTATTSLKATTRFSCLDLPLGYWLRLPIRLILISSSLQRQRVVGHHISRINWISRRYRTCISLQGGWQPWI